MTISDPSGESLHYSLLGLASTFNITPILHWSYHLIAIPTYIGVDYLRCRYGFRLPSVALLLFEALITLEEFNIPNNILLRYTPYEVTSTLRRLFPAFMNGCRCVIGSYYQDPVKIRQGLLQQVVVDAKALTLKFYHVANTALFAQMNINHRKDVAANQSRGGIGGSLDACSSGPSTLPANYVGLVAHALKDVQNRLTDETTLKAVHKVRQTLTAIADPAAVQKLDQGNYSAKWEWVRNLALYVAAIILLNKFTTKQALFNR